jgi:polar amino acid transport system substrate-binding protein
MTSTFAVLRRLGLAWTAVILTVATGTAFAQQPPAKTPGSGYPDPEGVPVRPATPDIAPVYRPPSIDTLATIRQRGLLRVGVAPSDPYVMRDKNGDLMGLSIEAGRQLAQDIGVDVEFVSTSWTQIIPDLIGNRFDVILSGLWVTPTRALLVNFSTPAAGEGIQLVASKKLAGTFKTKADFDKPGVTIVVYSGSSQEELAARLFPNATLMRIEGDADPITPLRDGKAHAALVTTPVPEVLVKAAPELLTLPFSEPLQGTATALAVRKGDPDFLNYVNSWLEYYRETGWLDEKVTYWNTADNWISRR